MWGLVKQCDIAVRRIFKFCFGLKGSVLHMRLVGHQDIDDTESIETLFSLIFS